ncbi:MAG: glycosyltransferase family 2 protein [candidate division Zixibacteria bacterium]|nr:glycosyltransferase family 2 protein [candidate division Zixibacteria bacterium]
MSENEKIDTNGAEPTLSAELPVISVVVPIRNEERFIARTLDYILTQDYPDDKLEVLVVEGQSDDNTVEIVKSIADSDHRVTILDNPKRRSSAARNIGAEAATGEIVTFIDGHVYIDNDQLLKNTALLMSEKDVSTLSRPQILDTPENSFFQEAVSIARKSTLGHGLDSTIYSMREDYVDPTSSGASYKQEVFEKAGYFNEEFDAAEDVEYNYRVSKAGFKSYTSPKLAVYYYPRDSLAGLFKQLTRYGVGRFRFMRKHSEAISSGALIPAVYFFGLVCLMVLSLLSEQVRPVLDIYIGVYLAGILLGSLLVAMKKGIEFLFILPAIYLCIHGGLAWGFLSEAARSFSAKREEKSLHIWP